MKSSFLAGSIELLLLWFCKGFLLEAGFKSLRKLFKTLGKIGDDGWLWRSYFLQLGLIRSHLIRFELIVRLKSLIELFGKFPYNQWFLHFQIINFLNIFLLSLDLLRLNFSEFTPIKSAFCLFLNLSKKFIFYLFFFNILIKIKILLSLINQDIQKNFCFSFFLSQGIFMLYNFV